MKQDMIILSSRPEHTEPARAALAKHDILATIVPDTQEVLTSLHTHTPAFLWLDLDTDDARPFLAKIMDRFLYPPPYIILTSAFSGSTDRADMLDQGADACVELPVDLSEILAILNAVMRREGRLRCVRTGSLLPCIAYKELLIDPLRRTVRMRGEAISLTPKEFDLLYLLANSPGIVFSKEQIYSHIWKAQGSWEETAYPIIFPLCVKNWDSSLKTTNTSKPYLRWDTALRSPRNILSCIQRKQGVF